MGPLNNQTFSSAQHEGPSLVELRIRVAATEVLVETLRDLVLVLHPELASSAASAAAKVASN